MERVKPENYTTFYVVYPLDKLVKEYYTDQFNDEFIYPSEARELRYGRVKPHCRRYKGKWGVSDYRMAFDNEDDAFAYIDNEYESTINWQKNLIRIAEGELEDRKKELELLLTRKENYEKAKNLRTASNNDTHEEQESER